MKIIINKIISESENNNRNEEKWKRNGESKIMYQ